MGSETKLNIEGLDEVKKFLDRLPQDINDKIKLDINKRAGRIAAKALQEATPEGINNKRQKSKLAQQITVTKSDTSTGVFVGFKRSGFAALFLERGTRLRQTLGKGSRIKKKANRGIMTAKPFVEKTFENISPAIVDFLNENYIKIINSSIAKQLGKYLK